MVNSKASFMFLAGLFSWFLILQPEGGLAQEKKVYTLKASIPICSQGKKGKSRPGRPCQKSSLGRVLSQIEYVLWVYQAERSPFC